MRGEKIRREHVPARTDASRSSRSSVRPRPPRRRARARLRRRRAMSNIGSVAGPSHALSVGPQRCQASAAVCHCSRVVRLYWVGSNRVAMSSPVPETSAPINACRGAGVSSTAVERRSTLPRHVRLSGVPPTPSLLVVRASKLRSHLCAGSSSKRSCQYASSGYVGSSMGGGKTRSGTSSAKYRISMLGPVRSRSVRATTSGALMKYRTRAATRRASPRFASASSIHVGRVSSPSVISKCGVATY